MPFSLRLDPQTDALIRQLTSKTGLTKAQLVREAVAQYTVDAPEGAPAAESTFDSLKAFAGVVHAGGAHNSVDTHRKYRERLEQKHSARRPR